MDDEKRRVTMDAGDPVATAFLKWQGGKRRLAEQIVSYVPKSGPLRYIEPFLGGGSVFWVVQALWPEVEALLTDTNRDLMNLFKLVRDKPEELMQRADALSTLLYHDVRKAFNEEVNEATRGVQFLYLNKRGFNGLVRYSRTGKFNVPEGRTSDGKLQPLYDRANILACSKALQRAELRALDYRYVLHQARTGDFVYSDPPYVPISDTSRFTGYTAHPFDEPEQRSLIQELKRAVKRGATVVASNSHAEWVVEAYMKAGFEAVPVEAARMGGASAGSRGTVEEYLFVGRS